MEKHLTTQQRAMLLAVGAALGLGACDQVAAPPAGAPPYLAVVPTIVAPTHSAAGTRYQYHVRELSGSLGVDTVVSVAPRDTVILSVTPATYVVDIGGLPAQCHSREGTQAVVIAPQTNTTVVRYFVVCQAQFTMSVFADGSLGAPVDSVFVYHLAAGAGERLGLLKLARGQGADSVNLRDTLELQDLPTGRVTFDLADVAPNCAVTSDGGAHRVLDVDSAGGAHLDFVVHCSNPADQPHVLDVHATYRDGVAGLVFGAGDAGRDMDRYFWDITDCKRKSVLPAGQLQLGGLQAGRTENQDTITVLVAFDIGLPDSVVRSGCMALWVGDSNGNLSEIVERPFGSGGSAPSATSFNARFLGLQALRTDLAVQDPNGDFLGVFVKIRLRDGTFGAPNGSPDSRFLFNYTGNPGSTIPDVGLYPPLTYDKYQAVIVYLLDAQANVTRLEDDDLFH